MDELSSRLILFVAYPGVGLLDLTGPFTVFWSASRFMNLRGGRTYERRLATVSGGPVPTTDGLTVIALSLIHI